MAPRLFLFVFTLTFFGFIKGQDSYGFFYVDSLNGFDEEAAKKMIISEGFVGDEFPIKLNSLKKNFVNNKYNLVSKNPAQSINYLNRSSIVSALLNDDFEQSLPAQVTTSNQILGWDCYEGSVQGTNACILFGCCQNTLTGQMAVVNCPTASGFIDPTIGGVYPIYSVFGNTSNNGSANNPLIPIMKGDKVFRLNNNINNYSVSKISKTFSVTPSNAIFQFAYISIFSTGHGCCEGSSFRVKITDVNTNSLVPCPGFSIAAPGAQCTTITPVPFYVCGNGAPFAGSGSLVFNKWKINSVDLTLYIGQTLAIDFLATDCNASGHYGYAYLDTKWGPSLSISVNDSVYTSLTDTFNIVACNTDSIFAPQGFNFYLWNGPVNALTYSLSPALAGTYTLTLGQAGGCGTITKIVNIAIQPTTVQVTSTSPTLCIGNTITLSVSGLSNNIIWSNGAALVNTINVAPIINTTYSVTGIGAYGCAYDGYCSVFVSPCTGINSISADDSELIVFPNPNSGEFTVKIKRQSFKGEMLITNSIGQTVHSQKIFTGENKIKTKGLAPGIYYFSVNENKELTRKGTFTIE